MNHRFMEVALILAALGGCASRLPVPQAPLYAAGPEFEPPPPDKAQIIFFVPGNLPVASSANGLFDLAGTRPSLIGVLAAHTGSIQMVSPGHHIFMTYGRVAHLMEADLRAGARYFVVMRYAGPGGLQPMPVRATEHDAVTMWTFDFDLVGKTPLADEWFAKMSPRVSAALTTALSAWRQKSDAERAALTLNSEDADP
jgi:hypothetical protein